MPSRCASRGLHALRTRVAELEQAEVEYHQIFLRQREAQKTLETLLDTVQKEEFALIEANRRMDEFLSIVSHELRTPLTTINGNIQLAKRRLYTLVSYEGADEELLEKLDLVHELLSRAERQVKVQNRLVSDLLDVSRIQANRLDLHMQLCELTGIIQETLEDLRLAHPSRQVTLDLPDIFPVTITADRDRISQVITNYVTNALKYSGTDHPVEVRLEANEGIARVSVRDEGPGLPLQEQERLWQRFYRVPGINVQSGSGVGLGLGLHICKTIIERHQGQVGVQSTPGMGSTFWFTLPRAE